jgi:hypothetical protein
MKTRERRYLEIDGYNLKIGCRPRRGAMVILPRRVMEPA